MDGQNQKPAPNKILDPEVSKVLGLDSSGQKPDLHTVVQAAQSASSDNQGVPKKATTDADAQALLATFNAQNPRKPERKLPMGMLITIATLIIIVVIASVMIGALNSKGKSNSLNAGSTNSTSSNNTDESTGQGVSNQINNDAKSCQNLATAVSQC